MFLMSQSLRSPRFLSLSLVVFLFSSPPCCVLCLSLFLPASPSHSGFLFFVFPLILSCSMLSQSFSLSLLWRCLCVVRSNFPTVKTAKPPGSSQKSVDQEGADTRDRCHCLQTQRQTPRSGPSAVGQPSHAILNTNRRGLTVKENPDVTAHFPWGVYPNRWRYEIRTGMYFQQQSVRSLSVNHSTSRFTVVRTADSMGGGGRRGYSRSTVSLS